MRVNRGYWEYKKFVNKPSKKFTECNPTILVDFFDLFSDDNTLMTKNVIKEQCECKYKSDCIRIVELLGKKQLEPAMELLLAIKANDELPTVSW